MTASAGMLFVGWVGLSCSLMAHSSLEPGKLGTGVRGACAEPGCTNFPVWRLGSDISTVDRFDGVSGQWILELY